MAADFAAAFAVWKPVLIRYADHPAVTADTSLNFKAEPTPELIDAVTRLTEAGFNEWSKNKWVTLAHRNKVGCR